MEIFVPVSVSVVGILAAAVLALIGYRRRRRAKENGAWARRHGWTHTKDGSHLRGRFRGTPFVRWGKYRYVLAGEHRGRAVLAFEYRYTKIYIHGPIETRYFQVVTVRVPRCPRLEVIRQDFVHKLFSLFGAHDLRLGNEEFDNAVRVRTDHDGFARQVLHPETMRWMLSDPRALEVPFRFGGDILLGWREMRLEGDEVLEHADFLIDLLDRTPRHVLGDVPPAR
ncbi:hypothetical protein F4561_001709 [Lipingzhangella halophila]|uniref:DUF3137 domain-containing protein n=1 Tax=Lipingzhangella halophila TaxID=1783352 RepID=A0A7W7RF65_9ACTN|nr:hypothetical protein [Lipingzhangella halophila]MBB4930889.1 hypothetical protein [Lipingzhangella halophila]